MDFGFSRTFSISIFGSFLLLGVMVPLNLDNNLNVSAQLGMSQQPRQQSDPTLNEQSNNDSTFGTEATSSLPIPIC